MSAPAAYVAKTHVHAKCTPVTYLAWTTRLEVAFGEGLRLDRTPVRNLRHAAEAAMARLNRVGPAAAPWGDAMLYKLTYPIYRLFKHCPLALPILLGALFLSAFGSLIYAKWYQRSDKDPDRGAIAFEKTKFGEGAFGENYSLPIYLEQGWKNFDSLWFYNTSQGSGLMPYDLFMALKQVDKDELFRSDA